MFKKTTLSALAIIALTATVQAEDYSIAKQAQWYMNVSKTHTNSQDTKILTVQPVQELVPEAERIGIEIGKSSSDGMIQVGIDFGYAAKIKQQDAVLAVKLQSPELYLGLFKPFYTARVGYGWLNDKGVTKDISTNVTIPSFITSQNMDAFMVPSKALFQQNTYFLEWGFELGTAIQVTKNFDLITAYQYQSKIVQFDYKVQGKELVDNRLTPTMRNNNLKLALSYKF